MVWECIKELFKQKKSKDHQEGKQCYIYKDAETEAGDERGRIRAELALQEQKAKQADEAHAVINCYADGSSADTYATADAATTKVTSFLAKK